VDPHGWEAYFAAPPVVEALCLEPEDVYVKRGDLLDVVHVEDDVVHALDVQLSGHRGCSCPSCGASVDQPACSRSIWSGLRERTADALTIIRPSRSSTSGWPRISPRHPSRRKGLFSRRPPSSQRITSWISAVVASSAGSTSCSSARLFESSDSIWL